MIEALKSLLAETQQRLAHADILLTLLNDVNTKNSQLLQKVSRLEQENARLKEIILREHRANLTAYEIEV